MVLPVPRLMKSVMTTDWLGARGCDIVGEDKFTFFVKVNSPCPHLVKSEGKFSCDIYKSRPEGCRIFDGRSYDFLDCAWKEKFVVLEKGFKTGFRAAKGEKGEEEAARERKEKKESGDYTPNEERFKERAKRRREEQEPPEV